MLAIVEWIVEKFGIPLVMAYMKKRDEDPKFAAKADVIFSEWSASSTTAERKKALGDLASLIKG